VDGSVSDAQAAAFAMAVFLRGMTDDETAALGRALAATGDRLEWPDLGPVADKHSTGGVGDKVSLILAPLVAAAGVAVPMVSGRGLGHTGGTLDKLDSIPGYATGCGLDRFRAVVREAGCAIAGPPGCLAPADDRLYAIRDSSGSVESIPLTVASILAKKVAAGVRALVLDAKVGSGAMSRDLAEVESLARPFLRVAAGVGIRARVVATDMDRVLGRTAGNALEVRESIAFLRGEGRDPRLAEVTMALAEEMLALAGAGGGRARIEQALASGDAADRFSRMVAALGGPTDLADRPDRHLPSAPVVLPVVPDRRGFVAAVDARALGVVVVLLGGGRIRADSPLDLAVGLSHVLGPGDPTGPDAPLVRVHARTRAAAESAARAVRTAYRVADAPPPPSPVVLVRRPDGAEKPRIC
jgi:thymidine phosphorylase